MQINYLDLVRKNSLMLFIGQKKATYQKTTGQISAMLLPFPFKCRAAHTSFYLHRKEEQ